MKKMTISCVLFLAFNATYAQIGVNTPDPSATFDITAKNTTGVSTNVDGLLIPRVDRERAQNMLAVPTSTLIYVNNISTGTQTGTAVNIDDSGYYYFDETVWKKLNSGNATDKDSNIYNINGSLLDNRTVSQGNKTLAFTGTANNAFSVDGSTFSVDANANSVGIGTTAPGSKLSIIGNFALGTNYAGLSAPSNGAIIQGAVGIGTNNASPAKLRVVSQNDDVANEYHFDDYSGSTNKYNALRFHKSRGTVAAPANLNNGDNIGSIEFIPHFNGTVEPYHNGTGINALYEGNGTDNLTSLRFFTSGDMPYTGERMRIDPKGNVGIGTKAPTNLLHLNSSTNGALKIVDGTQGTNKVLTSDANGVATWKDPNTNIISGVIGEGYDMPLNTIDFHYTGSYIDLPPGKWLVSVNIVLGLKGADLNPSDFVWVRSTFSDENLTTIGELSARSTDVYHHPKLMSGLYQGPSQSTKFNMLIGNIFIINSSAGTKRYSLIIGKTEKSGDLSNTTLNGAGSSNWGENSIFAQSIK